MAQAFRAKNFQAVFESSHLRAEISQADFKPGHFQAQAFLARANKNFNQVL